MYKALGRFALKAEHNRCDSAVVVILTHGEHGEVFGVDDRSLKIDDCLRVLAPHNCPALAHKPKLFFIQACRGSGFDKGHAAGGDFADMAKEFLEEHGVDATDGDEAKGGDTSPGVRQTMQVLRMVADGRQTLTAEEQLLTLQGMDEVDAKNVSDSHCLRTASSSNACPRTRTASSATRPRPATCRGATAPRAVGTSRRSSRCSPRAPSRTTCSP